MIYLATATGVGTILYRGQTVPPPPPDQDNFIPVGKVRNIGGPQIQKEQVEETSLESVGGFKEYQSGLREPGQLAFTINFDPSNSQHIGIRADAQASSAASKRNWRIRWANGEQADLVGEVMGYNRDAQPNEILSAEITLQISSLIQFT